MIEFIIRQPMPFIAVNRVNGGTVTLNPSRIKWLERHEGATDIYLIDGDVIAVKEAEPEIMKRIDRFTHITVKGG